MSAATAAVLVLAGTAGADLLTIVNRSVAFDIDLTMVRSTGAAPETGGIHRAGSGLVTDNAQLNLGNTGGTPPYNYGELFIVPQGLQAPLSGAQGALVARLWTGATGSESHLTGMVRLTFTLEFLLDGPVGNNFSRLLLSGSVGPYSGIINPVSASVHTRGADYSLVDVSSGQTVLQNSTSTAGFNAQNFTWYNGSLPNGHYALTVHLWANWDAVGQNGNGWSSASLNYALTVPAPGALLVLGAPVLAVRRRR